MKTNKLRRKPVSTAKGRWLAYAAAGAATSLGGTHSAEAEIHYSGVIDATIGKHPGYIHINIPLDHSAGLRFFTRGIYQLAFSIKGAAVSNSICGYENRFGSQYVSRLSQGVVLKLRFLSPRRYLPYRGALQRRTIFRKGDRLCWLPLQ